MATEVTEAQPSTSSAADKPEDTKEVQDAFNLLAQGKRNMLCGEVPKAVQQLEEACRVLGEKYGEVADQCGDAYLAYGSALLDLSRMESGVLGNALKGIESESEEESVASDDKVEDPEKVSEQEKEEIGDKVIDAMLETDEEQKARAEKEKTDGRETEDKKDEKTDDDKKEERQDSDKKEEEKMDVDGDKSKEGEKVDANETKEEEEKSDAEKTKEEKTDADKSKEEVKTDANKTKEEEKKEEKDAEKTKEEENKEEKDADKTKEEEKEEKDADKSKEAEKKEEKDAEKKEEKKDGEKEEAMETEEKKDGEGEAEGEAEEGEEGEESEALETEEEKEEAEGEEAEGEKKSDTSQEDVSNLQLAWEMLELAKVIYSRHEGKDMKLKAAEAHLKLGEVGLETEQYETAIEDFKSCLKIQQEFLDAESRLIAETHYQIGLACTLACRYTEALDNYRLAVKTIECKIAKLKVQIEESEKSGKHKEAGSFDENVIIAEKEIKDLSEILPDIRAKIEDTEDEMKSQDKVKELVKESVAADMETTVGFGGETSTASPTKAPSGPAKDISHMIRKKRKPEDEPEEDETAKKARQDDDKKPAEDAKAGGDGPTTNGAAEHVNGTNGTTSPEKKEEIKTKTVDDVKKVAEGATA